MTNEVKTYSERVYEEAPFETVRWLRMNANRTFLVTVPGRVTSVGAKAVVVEVMNIYGEPQFVSVPIEDLRLSDPSYPAVGGRDEG